MIKFKVQLVFMMFFVTASVVSSQQRVGEWTDYQSYGSAKKIVDTGSKIYCITEGGMFSYDKGDNSIQKISGINGLSDVGVDHLAYNKENNLLLIAYQNANIDLMFGNEMFNISDIKRKQIPASKTINNVLFIGDYAYLSCGFGIVVVNFKRKEIKDTYYIGENGDFLNVWDLASDGKFFYAATDNGIYKASAIEPSLHDYHNWVRETNIPSFSKKFNKIEYFGEKIVANLTPEKDAWAEDRVYVLNGDEWNQFLPDIHYVSDITENGKYILFSSKDEIFIYSSKYELVNKINRTSYLLDDKVNQIRTSSAIYDDQDVLWIADNTNGLVKLVDGYKPERIIPAERIIPMGPVDNQMFSLTTNGNDLWIASGGVTDSWNNKFSPPQFQLYRDGKWSVFDSKVFPNTNDFRDIVCMAIDPKDPDHIFAGSWGGGVLECENIDKYDNADNWIRYDNYNTNGALQNSLPNDPSSPYVRVGGMDFDSKGTLWVSNNEVPNVISSFDKDEKWKSYEIPGLSNKFVRKLLVTQNDDKWIIPKDGNLYALNSKNTTSKEQNVTAYFSNGKDELYTNMPDVNTFAEDRNGELWVGTATGVAVFSNPEKIWDDKPMYATRPSLNNSGDNNFHPLLEKESITSIAVDGANRKWFGTNSSGIFLISANGDEEIEHFNTYNSPLPSDAIVDIAINQNTGEVFVLTGSGLVSYMGEATAGYDGFADVYVSPNPVRETYDGPIVVRGLVENTDVKITDISGNLVYKTTSLGGQAIWDGRNLNGNRCKTGVYLVLMNDATGGQTKITKLLFIH